MLMERNFQAIEPRSSGTSSSLFNLCALMHCAHRNKRTFIMTPQMEKEETTIKQSKQLRDSEKEKAWTEREKLFKDRRDPSIPQPLQSA
jgi:hypothetical protein